MTAFYSEWDPYAAQWLRNLIDAGHIASGVVDERSICDLTPADLAEFTQVHLFAGIGGWSLAARLAGWPDDRPLWTGSCPCQPFSVAGAGKGQADARHLWPEMFRLIAACRPDVVMGEQVAAAVGKSWLDGVHADLEGINYACGAVIVPACAVNAPHRRDRLWFVADNAERGRGVCSAPLSAARCEGTDRGLCCGCALAYSQDQRRQNRNGGSLQGAVECEWSPIESERCGCDAGTLADCSGLCGQVDSNTRRCAPRSGACEFAGSGSLGHGVVGDSHDARSQELPGECGDARPQQPTAIGTGRRVAWDDSEFRIGADGKSRRVKSGIRLLAHGVSGRVARLRANGETSWYSRIGALKGFGNAIVPQVAAEIIGAYLDCEPWAPSVLGPLPY